MMQQCDVWMSRRPGPAAFAGVQPSRGAVRRSTMNDIIEVQFDLTPPKNSCGSWRQTSATKSDICYSSMPRKRRSAVSFSLRSGRGYKPAACADCGCSKAAPNLKVAPAGRALPRPSLKNICVTSATPATAWSERKSLRRCGAHQGHVFPDGPPAGRGAFLHKSGSLEFTPQGELVPDKLRRGAPEGEPWRS